MSSYDFWMKAIKDPAKIGSDELPVHEGHPQYGFYRMRDKDGGDMIPVAIWGSGDILKVKVGDRVISGEKGQDVWTFCCREPVTEEAYRAAMDGKGWPDSPPAKKPAEPVKKEVKPEEISSAPIGHNLPDDPHEALTLEFQGELEIAKELLAKPVTDQDQANKIANFSKRVSALAKKANEQFAIEKRPHLDASRACDDKWRELREDTDNLVKQLKKHIETFLLAERRKEQERQRKAAEEAAKVRAEAEAAQRKAAEEAAAGNEPDNSAAEEAERLEREAKALEKEAQEKKVSSGRTGAKVSIREVKVARITDYDALLMALKDRDEVKELVSSLANRAARSGVDLPGMTIEIEEKAV